ncbi:HAD family hydrolase [Planomicrobium sp. CPCC 101079]|uniref:HAD family hydrolase n=1 Tax=Planomicrobium sp. CPCC 101079 TaxID=2599618 RepID=UPI0011B55B24|nr:HAD family hydrolase [Planomicrobium sp. CPCC 101079]TWT09348.1 HAD family hydrolase [Planomicrobium sp. CPCC 101079]
MDSIIFDLDGTLWDSREAIALSWNQVFEGLEEGSFSITKDDLTAMMGLQIDEIGEKLLPQLPADKRKELLNQCSIVENDYLVEHGGTLYPEVEKVLASLAQKYKLFIVSNCQEGYIEAFLEYYGFEKYIKDFENPGRTGLLKGENIKLVMDRNNLTAPIYVGDTKKDQEAAELAGIPFVYAEYGFGEVQSADYTIRNFNELATLF